MNNNNMVFMKLNDILIDHYDCFNRERFYLDEVNVKTDFISIVSSIEDSCPVKLCKNIAKFTYQQAVKLGMNPPFIYVGAWAIRTDKFSQ